MVKEKNNCSLWILVARTDVAFITQTIPHLVRMCDYPFAERVLAIDTAPLSGEKVLRPNLGTLNELQACCQNLKVSGVIDRIVEIDYSDIYRKKAYYKHFGSSRVLATHNWKGAPFLGYIFCIEECKTDYFLHFDSDILLYQKPGFNWVEEGIKILRGNPDILYVRPQVGPQDENGGKSLYKEYGVKKEPGGFYKLNGFSSRCFLIDRKRFEEILPLKIMWAKRQGRIKDRLPRFMVEALHTISGMGLLESWEIMVGEAMKQSSFLRADIADNKAWTLHPPDHGEDFIKALPGIIERVERGDYPPLQAGIYDLKPEHWA
jgi:hypothetical protein